MTKRTLLRILERERIAAAAERAMLLDRIMHLTGKTWTPPPEPESAEVLPWEPRPRAYEANALRFPAA